jgi:NADPH:quinone reductase-like Zn-dependent oxidoreductase
MGSHEDFRLMLRAAGEAGLEPVVDAVLPLSRGPEAMARMEAAQQFGKIVLAMRD